MGAQEGSSRAEDDGGPRFDGGSGVFRGVTASGGPLIGTRASVAQGNIGTRRLTDLVARGVVYFILFILGLSSRSVVSRQVLPGVGGVRVHCPAREMGDRRLLGAEAQQDLTRGDVRGRRPG